MIPNKHPHTGPPGRLVTWGSPWHGPHQQGEVTLPTGAKMALPQADQGGSGGDVLVFRPPGTALPPRPPEWLAADAEAGREWRDYALITGRNNRCLYGKSLGKGHGCWLYAAPDGSRWLVSIGGMHAGPADVDFTVPWTRTFTATRFGDIAVGAKDVGEWSTAPPAAQETYTTGATLSAWQQAIPGKSGGDYSIDTLGSITAGKVWLEDASITGTHAVLMAGLDYPAEAIKRRSLGFVEVAMTGTPGVDWTVTLSVLRTRLQTLGTYENTEDRTTAAQEAWVSFQWVLGDPLEETDEGTPPGCVGHWVYNITTAYEITPLEGFPDAGESVRTYTGQLTFRVGFLGRIIAMAFHGDSETPGEVKMDAHTLGVFDMGDIEISTAGGGIRSYGGVLNFETNTCQANISSVTGIVHNSTWSQTVNGHSESNFRLTMPDGSVRNSPMTGSAVGSVNYDVQSYRPSPATISWSAGSRSQSYTDGDFWVGPGPFVFYSGLLTYCPFINTRESMITSANDGFFADRVYLATHPPGTYLSSNHGLSYFRTQLRRYSNKLWEFEAIEFHYYNDHPNNDVDLRTIQMGAAGTGGQVNSTITTEAGQTVPPYGSHNPESGEITRAQALPVVYV